MSGALGLLQYAVAAVMVFRSSSRRLAVVLAALACGSLALTATPALALNTHVFSTSFGSSGSGAGQLALASNSGVAVNSSTHDVYVADTGNARVDQFSSSGTFIRAWGWGVADGITEEFQTCTLTCFKGVSGSKPGQFTAPTFIAVDNSGGPSTEDVYVGDSGTNLVQKFDASGNLISGWGSGGQLNGSTATKFGALAGIAVDSSGNLFVYDQNEEMFEFGQDASFVKNFNTVFAATPAGIAVDSAGNLYIVRGNPNVEKISSTGADLGQITTGGNATGLAIDPSSNDIYVDAGGAGIDHYDPLSCHPTGADQSGCTPTDSFGSTHLSGAAGLVVDSSNHNVYAADSGDGRIAVFTPAVLPDVTTNAASNVGATTATLNGAVNANGTTISDCHFEYVTDAAFQATGYTDLSSGGSVPCDTTPSGPNPTPVHAGISGLNAGTAYHFRLAAANSDGTTLGADRTVTIPIPPSLDATLAQNLGLTSVDLTAKVNPNHGDTSYHFEYGTDTSYGTSVPVPDADIGSGAIDVAVSQHITGLFAGTLYHFRLVAHNVAGTTIGADHTFAYDTSGGGLPDGRAYEMVTPPQKNAALVGDLFLGDNPDISEDGSRLIEKTVQCFAGAGSCDVSRGIVGVPYAFSRTSGGWVATSLAPPATQFDANSNWLVSADAGTALFSMPTPPGGEDDWYARRPADGSFVDIGPATPGTGVHSEEFSALTTNGRVATADLSRVVYQDLRVWSFDATEGGKPSLYEYAGTGNPAPVLVGVSGGPGTTDLISVCGTEIGGSGSDTPVGVLSADGRTVYFTALACASGSGVNASPPVPVPARELYARIDESRTVLISERSPADCTSACQSSEARDAQFRGASADGSKVFFTSTQQLRDGASQDSQTSDSANGTGCGSTTGPNGCNLYLYDFANPAGHNLIDVSAGDTSGEGPRVQGLLAFSTDGSHVYFVARGVLTGAPNGQEQTAQNGANNLYVFERDTTPAGGHVAFITALPGSDVEEWRGEQSPVGNPANVTPDGRFLVFTSHGALTPDDARTDGAQQVFRYDAQTEQLVRLSIGEHGFNDNGNASTGDASIVPAYHFYSRAGAGRSDPTMSHDGSYVFFMSPVGLTPHALDDVRIGTDEHGNPAYAQNVYEYHGGHVSLISDGRDVSAARSVFCNLISSVCLIGTDENGANVFFTSADQLAPQDTDTQIDYYDARICTSSDPCVKSPPPSSPPCLGEACRGTPGATPSLLTPGSATFSGAGNLTPPPPVTTAPKTLTNAQKLARALKACRAKHNKRKRAVCKAQARKKYGAKKAKKASNKRRAQR
jgi:hypothetical protein